MLSESRGNNGEDHNSVATLQSDEHTALAIIGRLTVQGRGRNATYIAVAFGLALCLPGNVLVFMPPLRASTRYRPGLTLNVIRAVL